MSLPRDAHATGRGDGQTALGGPALELTAQSHEADAATTAWEPGARMANSASARHTPRRVLALVAVLAAGLGFLAAQLPGLSRAVTPVPTAAAPAALAATAAPFSSASHASAADAPKPSAREPGMKAPAPGPRPVQKIPARLPGLAPMSAAALNSGPEFVISNSAQETLASAYAALKLGRWAEAESLYKKVLKANDGERDALLGLAYIAHATDRPQEALNYYRSVLRQDPSHAAAGAACLLLSRELDLALTASRAREWVDRHPESAAAQSALGSLLVRQERLAEAALAYALAQELEPNHANHSYNLAVALDRLHRYDQAQIHYRRALAQAEVETEGMHGFSRTAAQQRLEQLRQAGEGAP